MEFSHSACSPAYQSSNCQNKLLAKWLNLSTDQPTQKSMFYYHCNINFKGIPKLYFSIQSAMQGEKANKKNKIQKKPQTLKPEIKSIFTQERGEVLVLI